MRRSGELVQWNNKGGYGFVRDDAGRDYYVHVSKLSGSGRPRIGDTMSFDTATGRKGRPSAIDVVITTPPGPAPTLRDVVHAPGRNVSRYKVGLRVATATMLTLLILLGIATGHAPVWLGGVYAMMGLASALLYRFDKLYAMAGSYRVSEANLQLVDLCFGIIGGLAAQEFYRHKTVKPRFVAATWSTALLHVVGLAALAFGWFNTLFGFAF